MSDNDGTYTFRGVYGDEVVEIEMTAEQAFDFVHRDQAIGHAGPAEPIIDEDGQLGGRHVTGAERERREEDDPAA
jgi:hypothetical protein